MQEKIEWPNGPIAPFEKRPDDKYIPIRYLQSCPRHKAPEVPNKYDEGTHKDGRCIWYGYETIGPRVYGLYQCRVQDHLIRRRLEKI